MRHDELQTWNAASLLFAMLLTVATVGTHSYYAATHFGTRGGSLGDPRALGDVAGRVAPPPPRTGARRAAIPVPSGTGIERGARGRGEALMLLMLLGQGGRPTLLSR